MLNALELIIQHVVENTWALYLDAAPFVMIGLLSAGLIKAWVPQQRLASWLGGDGLWPITKAAVMGAPLPLCSCAVIPVALGLHRAGASRGSTLSFLIATPETGVDSIATSFALLGPFMTVIRPVTAILSGIVTGLLGSLVSPGRHTATPPLAVSSCSNACETQTAWQDGVSPTACLTSTCCDETGMCDATQSHNAWTQTGAGIRYAVTNLLDDFSVWLLIGLTFAGLTMTLVPPSALSTYGSGLPAMLVILLVSLAFYVCATESTPIATAMLLAGISPGVVLVFLLAGQATNLGSLGPLRKEFGWRFVFVYLAGISVSAIGFGLLTNYVVVALHIDIVAQLHVTQELLPEWIKLLGAGALTILALRPLRRHLPGLAPEPA